jgi:hypothetical protein
MPSGLGSQPEINPLLADHEDWCHAVLTALHANDKCLLAKLYRRRIQDVGSEKGTQDWLEIVSGWDASATTG